MSWTVNFWGVLVATVAYFVIGAVWYGALFGSAWMNALGKTREELGEGANPAMYALTFVLEGLAMLTLAVLLVNSPVTGFLGSAGYAALVALGVWVTLLAVTFAYESRKPGLFLIDGVYHLVAFAVGGAILSLF